MSHPSVADRRPDTGPGAPVPDRLVRVLAVAGTAATVLAALAVAVMHVLGPSSRVDPVRRTISEYALREGGWMFEVTVAVLALGSAAVLAALVAGRLVGPRSAPALLLGLWCVGLLLVVAFEKTNWSIGPSVSGTIHRYASLAAFLGLPAGALLLARRSRAETRWRPYVRPVRVASWLALASFAPIVVAIGTRPFTGVPWWRAVPLGLLERVVSVAEVTVVVVLGLWATALARTGRDAPV